MLKSICIIGAGNIGSRHLQALANIKEPLFIQVVDPFETSLTEAKKRYEQVQIHTKHQVIYLQDLNKITSEIDVAIIATTSNIRKAVAEKLLNLSRVNYIILEKLLFQKREDYKYIKKLLSEKRCKAWVNCNMRTTPFYANLKKYFSDEPLNYIVNTSQEELVTNAIHYIDHTAYLSNCYNFTLDTESLNKTPIESKRKGFLELIGTLNIRFKNGSFCSLTNYQDGNTPLLIEIFSQKYRCLIQVTKNKSFISDPNTNWEWHEEKTPILFQRQMTNLVVNSLLKTGSCKLPTYDISAKMHLALLEPLLKFLNANSKKKFKIYPFT